MTKPAKVTKEEIARSIAGAQKAGVKVGRVEIDHASGRVVIVADGSDDKSRNPCDRLLR